LTEEVSHVCRSGVAARDRILEEIDVCQRSGVEAAAAGDRVARRCQGALRRHRGQRGGGVGRHDDEAAIRGTNHVDVLIPRTDMPAARAALEADGFIYAETLDVPMFIDGPKGGARDAVHVLFAGEIVKPGDLAPSVDVTDSERGPEFQILTLEALLRMKLISCRDKDRTHIRDLWEVGLIDPAWTARFPPELAVRLQHIFDTPGR